MARVWPRRAQYILLGVLLSGANGFSTVCLFVGRVVIDLTLVALNDLGKIP